MNKINVEIPFKRNEYGEFIYYILVENQIWNSNEPTNYVCVPNLGKTVVSSIVVQKCATDNVLVYNCDKELLVIPEHDKQCYGSPIFTSIHSYSSSRDDYDYPWNVPENFFTTYEQAKGMLEYLKQRYGFIEEFDNKKYSRICPVGMFNGGKVNG